MTFGPVEITLLGVVATAVIGVVGYFIRRGIEEQDVLTVKIDGQPTVHLAVQDDLRAMSLGYTPVQGNRTYNPSYMPEVKYGNQKVEPYPGALQIYGSGSSKINYTLDSNRQWTLDVGPMTVTPPQGEPFLPIVANSGAAEQKGQFSYNLFGDTAPPNLKLSSAVVFQGSQALIDPGTVAYGNQNKSIGLLAKYDPATFSKVEIIDNEKEFVFRLEKK